MSGQQADRGAYRFEDYEFTARDCELQRSGEIVPLARKPSRLLLLLLQNRGRMVARDDILAALWPDVRVSDAAVSSVVRDLRRALHDEARQPRLIATSRGRGLRFLAPVEVVGAGPSAGVDAYLGRTELLERLHASATAAIGGRGRLVLLSGEAGIGKTRTAAEIANHARRLGASAHLGRCWPQGTAPPFSAWVELFASIREKLDDRWRGPLRHPSIASILAPESPIEDGDHTQARFEAFDALAADLCRAARLEPLVLTIDDLEYADDASLRLLEIVTSKISDARILILACYRTLTLEGGQPLAATMTRLARRPNFEHHLIRGFDAEEAARFVRVVAGREVDDARIEALCRSTDGNPFLLSLLARSIESDPERLVATSQGVPILVRDWIRGALSSLPDDSVACLRAAAVLGRMFRVSSVAAMLGKEWQQVDASFAAARRAGLLATPSPASPLDSFAHALLHEAIYQDVPAHLRTELHWRAAETVRIDAPGEALSAVAHHLSEAVEIAGEGAVLAAERAADDAERRLAFEEAVRFRQLALRALESIGMPANARRCELLLDCARAQLALRQVEAAWENARAAAALARRTGNIGHLARAALILSDQVLVDGSEPASLLEEVLAHLPPDDSKMRARVASSLSQMLWYRGGSTARRIELAREALAIARTHSDPRLEVAALMAERNALHAPEHLARRLEVSEEALAIAGRSGSTSQRNLILSWRAIDRLEAGDGLSAQIDVDSVSRDVDAGDALRLQAFPLRWEAMRAMMAGRLVEAEAYVRSARERMVLSGDANAGAYAGIQGALLAFERGRSAEVSSFLASAGWVFAYREHVAGVSAALATVELESGIEGPARSLLVSMRDSDWKRFRESPEQLGTASWLAELCAKLADAEFAKSMYELLVPYGDRVCCFYSVACRGAWARYLGLLARTAGRFDEAAGWFTKSVAINRALGADLYVAWSRWEWAESIARGGSAEGDLGRARELAAEAAQFADEHGLGRLRAAQRSSPWAILLGVE